ncbi:MAG TPA: hypothetical protein VGG90_04210 [Candidatus Dormibacteraeota bacterium]
MKQSYITDRAPFAARIVKRNAHEPPMTEEFWRTVGRGSLILEYPLVIGGGGSERRRVDGLIVLDGQCHVGTPADACDLNGRSVMVVQTVAGRTDAAHVGQALLSQWLLRQRFPGIGTIESVLVTASPEPFLTAMLLHHGIREVTIDGPSPVMSRTHLTGVPETELDHIHEEMGGEMLIGVQLRAAELCILTASAVILAGERKKRTVVGRGGSAEYLIKDSVATAIVSTPDRLGMYVAGFAIVARELLLAAGAADASAIALVGTDDRAIREALSHFPGVTARLVAKAA